MKTGVKGNKERKKRVFTSMFDQYREFIETCLDSGMSLKETHELLPDGYTYGGFYDYIRTNKIREKAWKREVDARYVCDKCEYCKKIKNVKGEYNKADHRLCTKSWRLIQYSVRHCPRWCELEGKRIEERINRKKNS